MTRPLTIAVVDDEAPVRKALGRLLSASQINTTAFESGRQFLDSLDSARPDCVILDLHMPEMTGHDVQRALKRADASVPVIIITGFDEPEARVRCLAAGACAYLLKPLDDQVLLEAVANCTGTKPPCGTQHRAGDNTFKN